MATYYRWRKSTPNYTTSTSEISSDISNLGTGVLLRGSGYTESDGVYTLNDQREVSTGDSRMIYKGEYVLLSENPSVMYGADNGWFSVYGDSNSKWSLSVTSAGAVKYTRRTSPGTSQGYVYSTSPSAYPNGGVQGGYYYDQRTTVTSPTAPTGLTYPNPITTPTVTVSWDAATSNTDYPVTGYNLYYGKNGDESTTNIVYPQNNPNTSAEIQIPSDATSIRFWVGARDSNGSVTVSEFGPWVSVYLAPTLTVPQMVMQGQQATISWSAIEGADSYTLQRKSSEDADWVEIYSGANTTFSETVGTWTTVQYRVQAVFDGTPGGWAESAAIPVVSASSLVISGTDEDLGIITNDIPYSISTDTGNQITATITVNNAVIFSGNVGNSTADVIPVLDLITGEGTIVISATVEASGGPVTATRTWTYEKAAITFPNSGSVAQVTREGENIYPKVLAEGVRLPGGKTLDQVMGFPCQIYIGTKYGINNNTELEFPFNPKALLIFSGVAFGLFIQGANSGYCPIGSSSYEDSTVEWKEKSIRFVDSPFAANQTYTYVCFG